MAAEAAGREETNHLAWTEARLQDLQLAVYLGHAPAAEAIIWFIASATAESSSSESSAAPADSSGSMPIIAAAMERARLKKEEAARAAADAKPYDENPPE